MRQEVKGLGLGWENLRGGSKERRDKMTSTTQSADEEHQSTFNPNSTFDSSSRQSNHTPITNFSLLPTSDDGPSTKVNSDVLEFVADDQENPLNWPEWRKWTTVSANTLINLSISWGGIRLFACREAGGGYVWSAGRGGNAGLEHICAWLGFWADDLRPVVRIFWTKPSFYYFVWHIFVVHTWHCISAERGWILNIENTLGIIFFGHYWYAPSICHSGEGSDKLVANFGGTITDLWDSHDTGPASCFYGQQLV